MAGKDSHMRRLTAFLVCLCLVAAFLFSAWFIISHVDHDCLGDDCPICAQIHQYADFLQKLGAGLGVLTADFAILAAALLCAILAVESPAGQRATLVDLKVRLNN